MSVRRVEAVVGRSYEVVHQWYHRLSHLFIPESDNYLIIAIDETTLEVDDTETDVRVNVDVSKTWLLKNDVNKWNKNQPEIRIQ